MNKGMAERVEFDVRAKRGDAEFRIWTDGDHVAWVRTTKGSEGGTVGAVPRALFLLAVRTVAERCESEGGWEYDGTAAYDAMHQPIDVAMAWPHGSEAAEDPLGELGDALMFGFDSSVADVSIDERCGSISRHPVSLLRSIRRD